MQPQAGGGRGGGRGGRGGGPAPVRVGREPVSLSALAAGGGPLAERATRVLARLEWPGKPGATPITPLTPGEFARFEAGRTVFANLCVACHQSDGRGRDGVAPTLVGSDLAPAASGVTARIVLNGKEGSVGLMPPLGQSLSDDQIAEVLTYVRRQWGNVASPVDPAAVREARAATAGRTRPWSQDEIAALAAAAAP